MKTIFCSLILVSCLHAFGQTNVQNIFIITTDGFRWQEVFKGADSVLINDPQYVSDTSLLKQYWDNSEQERRKKLMPFFWNVIAKHGQLYGNRQLDNKVNVKNIYKISYPGYNELLTGYADPLPVLNTPAIIFAEPSTLYPVIKNSFSKKFELKSRKPLSLKRKTLCMIFVSFL